MKPQEVVALVLSAWSSIICTIQVIHELRKDRKKTAPRKRRKHKRKRR